MNETASISQIEETHPWAPWLPVGAKVLIMGTFPPGVHRWSMDFYYPNPTNDFWRITSLLLLGDPLALYDAASRSFDVNAVKDLTVKYGIAMSDTVKVARRLRGNASDKFLEVVEARDPFELLKEIHQCHDIATTGALAAETLAAKTGTIPPAMGEFTNWIAPDGREVRLWRMPSTSRAYPMKLDRKAEFYKKLFINAGIL